ncbi:MAG: serine/threonine protein kinase [Planctomycetes bacterium]|nr:serine/threonine protein kinase [Planctomycetota bacterium]
MPEPTTCPTCGAALAPDATKGACPACLLEAGLATGGAPAGPDRVPTIEELAPKFPGLEIEALVGRGGMGVVFRARHKALDREVALKILSASIATDRAFADRFQREARALAKLQHPNIVAVHDFGTTDGLFWLVMEYVDGVNVREAMVSGQVGSAQALAIVPQICDALQYAHEHGVVHRDIKPENILLDKAGRVKVADFGLAKLMDRAVSDASLTGAGQVMGTLHYMAPEQWERPKEVDHRADIYSLGVVFYEMLTGELPVGRFEPPSKRVQVDVRLYEIVLHSLERQRERRYQNVSEMKSAVGGVSVAVAATPAPATAASPAPVDTARVAGVAPREEDDLGKRRNIGEVILLSVLGVAFGAVAAATRSEGWVWTAGMCAIGAVVAAAMLDEQDQKDRLEGVAAPEASRLGGRWGAWWFVVGMVVVGGSLALAMSRLVPADPEPGAFEIDAPDGVSAAALEDERRDIERLWNELLAVHGTPAADRLYRATDWTTIQSIPESVRADRAKDGTLGLPLADAAALPEPLDAYGVRRVRLAPRLPIDGWFTTAVITLEGEESTVRAQLVYDSGSRSAPEASAGSPRAGWYFAMAPVEVVR